MYTLGTDEMPACFTPPVSQTGATIADTITRVLDVLLRGGRNMGFGTNFKEGADLWKYIIICIPKGADTQQ